jgi:transaldolase
MSASQLAQLTQHGTVVVVDSGDISAFAKMKVTDATTNPSLLLQAAGVAEYAPLLEDCVARAKAAAGGDRARAVELACDYLAVGIGKRILEVVPGRVSTEVDAKLSFDREGSIKKARELIALYEAAGVSKDRILIKLASTWEGIKAAEALEKEGIHCNLTLLFSLHQAVACAEANVTLISPFVGRILDWYKASTGKAAYEPHEDPGVVSVTSIYNYYKRHGHKTVVMGASFRNKEEITQLAGCDLLTIAPKLLAELEASHDPVHRHLDAAKAQAMDIPKIHVSEQAFRWALNEDQMATDKLSEGIRNFNKDRIKLEALIASKL